MTLLMVTHDVEFAAETADRCALFFDGEILSADTPSRFFGGNTFYTTAANRMARTLCPNAVTCGQVVDSARRGRTHEKNHFLLHSSDSIPAVVVGGALLFGTGSMRGYPCA